MSSNLTPAATTPWQAARNGASRHRSWGLDCLRPYLRAALVRCSRSEISVAAPCGPGRPDGRRADGRVGCFCRSGPAAPDHASDDIDPPDDHAADGHAADGVDADGHGATPGASGASGAPRTAGAERPRRDAPVGTSAAVARTRWRRAERGRKPGQRWLERRGGAGQSSGGTSRGRSAGTGTSRVYRLRLARDWISRSGPHRHRRTTLVFVLRRPALVEFVVVQVSPACRRIGTFRVRGHRGVNRVRLGGRVAHHLLGPGTYRIVARRGLGGKVVDTQLVVVQNAKRANLRDGPEREHVSGRGRPCLCPSDRGLGKRGRATVTRNAGGRA